MTNQLAQLREMTTVVADSGDIEAIKATHPEDATTNPSLLLKAVSQPEYSDFINQAVAWAKQQSDDAQQQVIDAADKLSVIIGKEILQHVPGKISTEVDARLSFDTQATIDKAHKLIALYEEQGVTKDRVLIKVASTWEGIKAAEKLEQEGIKCNLTLLFNFAQARACAEANIFLISPFVGRILDWYKANHPDQDHTGANDPGVQSVTKIYNYYKACGYNTVVMGASFRNIGEIQELAGCDRLTISPDLLNQLAEQNIELPRKLNPVAGSQEKPQALTEAQFRWELNQDPMATEKLAEGIRKFAEDQVKLENLIKEKL